MKRAIAKATPTQQAYQDRMRAYGCVVCRYRNQRGMQDMGQVGKVDIHHRNIGDLHGQKQIGQHAVLAMCQYHHAGEILFGWGDAEMREVYGPSFKLHARDFRNWTRDELPGMGNGTEAWQAWYDAQMAPAVAA